MFNSEMMKSPDLQIDRRTDDWGKYIAGKELDRPIWFLLLLRSSQMLAPCCSATDVFATELLMSQLLTSLLTDILATDILDA